VKVHWELVTKPDGSVTTTVYDNLQRVVSTAEKTAGGVVITGFEYTYDGKAIIPKHSKDFGGSLEDPDVIKLCGCSRNSYYKYKRELKTTF
jgi:hypothetical protein